MNRIEIVGLFTSLKIHVENNDVKAIGEIVNAVLDEAQYVKQSNKKDPQIQED